MSKESILVSAAAMLDARGRVLVQKRPPQSAMAGLWEFPGGKIEAGETPEGALVRELHEELGIIVEPQALIPVAFASAPLGAHHLILLLYLLRSWQGVPVAQQASAVQWLYPTQLETLAMPPADQPLVAQIMQLLSGT